MVWFGRGAISSGAGARFPLGPGYRFPRQEVSPCRPLSRGSRVLAGYWGDDVRTGGHRFAEHFGSVGSSDSWIACSHGEDLLLLSPRRLLWRIIDGLSSVRKRVECVRRKLCTLRMKSRRGTVHPHLPRRQPRSTQGLCSLH